MHAAARLLVVLCLAFFLGNAHAQLANGRYGAAQVFDAQRDPAFPAAGSAFTAFNFDNPVQGGTPLRYTLAAGEQVGFVEVSADPCRYSLNIYDSGGALVRTVHPSGAIHGLGAVGFLHVSVPGDYATFVANAAGYAPGDSVSYLPTTGAATCADTSIYAANTTPINTATPKFEVAGSVFGMTSSGLVLRLNGVTTLPVSADGPFAFPPIANGSSYTVEVATQPSGQFCLLGNGSGTLNGADVTNVLVDCRYPLSFTVSGLQADTFVSVSDGVDSLGGFRNGEHFTIKEDGQAYSLTVPADPTGHVCAVTGPAAGTISGAAVGGIAITCDPIEYRIGGSTAASAGVVGLAPGNTVRLRMDYTAAVDPCASSSGAVTCKVAANGSEQLPVTQNGDFSFTTQLNTGDGLSFGLATNGNPVTPYPQTCTPGAAAIGKTSSGFSGTVGTADINILKVDCTPAYYSVGGSVSGLAAGNSVLLRNSYGSGQSEEVEVSQNGGYTFPTLR